MPTLAAQLRAAIKKSELSVNRIAIETGIPQQVLQRFVAGDRDNLRLDTADKLVKFFELELSKRKGK